MVCYVPGCNSGYASAINKNKAAGKRNPSLFSAPKDVKLLQKWRRAIKRKDKVLTPKQKVCELHFESDAIIATYDHLLSDGARLSLSRGCRSLKPNAVPTIFPNNKKQPKHSTKITNDKKDSIPRTYSKKKNKISNGSLEPVELLTDVEQLSYIYDDFLLNLKSVHLPDSCWSAAATKEYLIWVKWNSKFECERRVILCKDLSVKIFLRDKEIMWDTGVLCTENLSSLLKTVNRWMICASRESIGCEGYVPGNMCHLLCGVCRQFRKNKRHLEEKEISTLVNI